MAKLYPPHHEHIIDSFSERIQSFIYQVIDFLEDDDYVIIKPFVDGDEPDLIVVQKDKGVSIFKFCNYSFSAIQSNGKMWRFEKLKFLSPFKHLQKMKDDFFNLHIPGLLEQKIRQARLWWTVQLIIVNEVDSIEELIKFAEEKNDKTNILKNFKLISNESIRDQHTSQKIFYKEKNVLFSTKIFDAFIKYLAPDKHAYYHGKVIHFNTKQMDILKSDNAEMIVKGVVGSGKTTLLAAKAVSVQKKTGGKVLILCYNITLINYIKEKLNNVYEDFEWDNFHVTNYHQLIGKFFNKVGVAVKKPDSELRENVSDYFERNYYSNYRLFEENESFINKYDAVFIDEVQDYKFEWLEIIKRFFLKKDYFYYLFGDEKQNVYNQKINKEERDLKLNIDRRKTRKLTESVRLTRKLTKLSKNFQKKYFQEKYVIDEDMQGNNGELGYGFIQYHNIPTDKKGGLLTEVADRLKDIDQSLISQETTVLGFSIDLLREIENFFRLRSQHLTQTMFETNEIYFKSLYNLNKTDFAFQEAYSFFPGNMHVDKKLNNLVRLKILSDFKQKTSDPVVQKKLENLLKKFNLDESRLNKWQNQDDMLMAHHKWPQDFRFERQLENIRNNKKVNFVQDSNRILFSTIHSYKGFENSSIIMLIEPKFHRDHPTSFEEVLYTGLTRAKQNLIILNFGNEDFDNFMKTMDLNE